MMPGPAVGYTDLLDYEITQKLLTEEDDRKTGKKRWHPLRPSASGYCGRRLAYDLMEYRGHAYYPKELKDPKMYRLLELGHSVEYSALRNFELIKKSVGLRYKQQTLTFFELERGIEGQPTELIEGSCDAVFWNEQWKCVMDVKSQKDGWSDRRSSRWQETLTKYTRMRSLTKISETAWYADDVEAFLKELGDDFLADNIHQLNLYACSDFLRQRGIDHAVIYKYNKNTSEHYELRFRPSLPLYERLQKKYNFIAKSVDAKEPEKVERDSVLGSMRCAFCPYNKECWGPDAKKAWYRTLPAKDWPLNVGELGEDADLIEKSLLDYEKLSDNEKLTITAEAEIIKLLVKNDARRIRTRNGEVYEVKFLKSPRPHFELRRSKA